MDIKFANYATSTIADVGGISAGDTSVSVQPGDGTLFDPDTVIDGSGPYGYATLVDGSGNREIVKYTNVSTDTLTIVRAQDGTAARAFAQNDIIEYRVVGATFDDLYAAALEDMLESGTILCGFGQNSAPTGWTRKSDWQDNAMICYAASGSIANGGGANPQSAHYHQGGSHNHAVGTLQFEVFTAESNGALYAANSGGTNRQVYSVLTNAQTGGSSSVLQISLTSETSYTRAGSGSVASGGVVATATNTAPYFQEVIAATRD